MITKTKTEKFAPETKMILKETQEITKLTAHVTTNASTFEWQKYSSYEKRLLIGPISRVFCQIPVVIEPTAKL